MIYYFQNIQKKIKALQWHSYEVIELENNKDVKILGSSQLQSIRFLNTWIMLMVFNFILR